jgi:segregation and condensation protein B
MAEQSSQADAREASAAGAGRFTLHRLSAAFARLTGGDATVDKVLEVSDVLCEVQQAPVPAAAEQQVLSPRMIVEAMLFVGHADGQPVTSRAMAANIRDVSPQEVDAVVAELNETYRTSGSSYHIVSQGAGYQMQLLAEHEPVRQRLSGRTRQARLSPQAVEVLSIVAYRQPVTEEEINRIRNARSNSLLNQLLRRGLVRLDRGIAEGQATTYRTTDRFNQFVNIRSPAELPRSEDLEDN